LVQFLDVSENFPIKFQFLREFPVQAWIVDNSWFEEVTTMNGHWNQLA